MQVRYSRKGFTSEAEEIAEEIRLELGIGIFGRLDPWRLAALLEIPVVPMSQLGVLCAQLPINVVAAVVAAVTELGKDTAGFSAVTVFVGLQRIIVHNDTHSPERQASDLGHEIAHSLLLHPQTPALTGSGLRDFKSDIENEAAYLGAALLIPGKAARGAMTRRKTIEEVAAEYGVSIELARWRINTTTAPNKRTHLKH